MHMSEESTPGAPQMQLFFVLEAVQAYHTSILADSQSLQNLISKAIYKKLPYKPQIWDPGNCQVIGGNYECLDLKDIF